MTFLPRVAELAAVVLSACGAAAAPFPDDTITGVASTANFIIKEVSTDMLTSDVGRPLRIRSDVPLTIQRFDDINEFEKNPVDYGDGVVLITSNCDTSTGPSSLPEVVIRKGEGGSTYVDIEVGVDADVANDYPFYEPSSYDVKFYEHGCGFYMDSPDPTMQVTRRPTEPLVNNIVEPTMCTSEAKCDEMRKKMGLTSFRVGEFPSKGCFSKNGQAYWSTGGTNEDMFEEDLPGVQQRIWCERVVQGPGEKSACTSQDKCTQMTAKMGMSPPRVGSYPTKGCFSKNGVAYWSTGGSSEEMSKPDLPGVQERIWCEDSGTSVDTPVGTECELGPDADPAKSCVGANMFCQLGEGVCNLKIGVHEGTCQMVPEACIEIYAPVCGCDGETYSNECKARSKGVNVSRKGNCGGAPSPTPSPCELGSDCAGANAFCQLEEGLCYGDTLTAFGPEMGGPQSTRSGVLLGTCEARPEACIEIISSPVCGCDAKTYDNECKARENGVNVSRKGKCDDPGPCMSEKECDERRKELGIGSFYVGDYPTGGCFSKNGKAYWNPFGSAAGKTTTDLPGVQERIWCGKRGGSGVSSALQQESTSKVQRDGEASGAFPLRSCAIGSLLRSVVPSRAASPPRTRTLNDPCGFNAEVLLPGCDSGFPASIQVAAPKARVINSAIENTKTETIGRYETWKDPTTGTQYYNKELKHTATLAFLNEDAELVLVGDQGGAAYTDIPRLSEDQCAETVCGRPFVDSDGKSLLASSLSAEDCDGTSSWLGETAVLNDDVVLADTSSTNQGSYLGEKWKTSALGEHASVASFAAFSIALMTNGAPSDLVEDSLKAAIDEVRHAKVSFDIASRLLGKDVGPGPLPPSNHHFSRNLTALAISVAKEGCVDETLSALEAATEVEMIDKVLQNGTSVGSRYTSVDTDLLVWIRNELHTISVDESSHSSLAWRTIDWVCSVDANACAEARQSVLNENKLIMAFQRRFGRSFGETPELLEQMMADWTNIYTRQGVLQPSCNVSSVDDTEAKACVGGG